jgi:hypothetical protein
LRTLQAITILGFFSNNIEDRVNELSALGVMALGPVIPSPGLPEYEVIGAEDLSKRSGSERIHGTRFEIHENSTWNVATTTSLVVINIDTLELKLRVSAVLSRVVNAMLIADHFPELGPNLVSALPTLDMQDFSHPFLPENSKNQRILVLVLVLVLEMEMEMNGG